MTEKLAYIKKLRHLTTEEIAWQSDVPLGTLNRVSFGQVKNPAVGSVDRITQTLRISAHYLSGDEFPIGRHVGTSTDDGILLLLSEEIQFLVRCRDLGSHNRRTINTMTELLNMPPGRLAGNLSVKWTFCYVTAPPGDSNPLSDSFFLRSVLTPEIDAAARGVDFVVPFTNGSIGPLYSVEIILFYKREHAPHQECGLFPPNQEAFIHRLYYKRSITKLVAPNLSFRDTVIRENDSLKCAGTITSITHGCRWE